MFWYENMTMYPVRIRRPDPHMASLIVSQLGGADSEMSAAMRYLNQRMSMPYHEVKNLLTDIGTEELGHVEIIGTMMQQLTKSLDYEDIRKAGFDAYFTDHTAGVYPQSAAGTPWTAAYIGVKGDPVTDLHEDLAAEQKARTTYENLLMQADDPDVKDVLRFLRQREIVHYQRFMEGLDIVQKHLDQRNYYMFNPAVHYCPAKLE